MSTLTVTPVAEDREPRSLAEQAYHMLVAKITRLQLPPGSLVVEKNLMAELGIGRTPIREALQRLAVEGLVLHIPNRGMFVSEISATGVQQIYEFRSIIDGHVARLAAMRASEAEIANLRRLSAALAHARETSDVDKYVELDRQFYHVLANAAQNTYLADVIPRIFNQHLRLWFFISSQRGGWEEIGQAHERMADDVTRAIARRDPDEAELAIKSYISRRHRDMRELL